MKGFERSPNHRRRQGKHAHQALRRSQVSGVPLSEAVVRLRQDERLAKRLPGVLRQLHRRMHRAGPHDHRVSGHSNSHHRSPGAIGILHIRFQSDCAVTCTLVCPVVVVGRSIFLGAMQSGFPTCAKSSRSRCSHFQQRRKQSVLVTSQRALALVISDHQ